VVVGRILSSPREPFSPLGVMAVLTLVLAQGTGNRFRAPAIDLSSLLAWCILPNLLGGEVDNSHGLLVLAR
jgi:hypothetical protein